MSTLLLFNPKDTPYGNLSPLADHIVSKSYASLIKSKMRRDTVGKMQSDKAREESLKIFTEIQDENYKTFLKEALKVGREACKKIHEYQKKALKEVN